MISIGWPDFLLGLDIARVLSEEDRRAMRSFLGPIDAAESWAHPSMLSNGPGRWRTLSA
jgi:hypothetical protein